MNRVIIVLYNVLSTDSNTNRLQPTGSDYFDLVEMIRACAKRKALRARTAEATPRRFASSQPRPNKKPPVWVVFLFGGDDQTRTDYLYVANVSLYRVSYIPAPESFFIIPHSRKFFNRFLCSFEKNFFDLFTFFLSSCERACPA